MMNRRSPPSSLFRVGPIEKDKLSVVAVRREKPDEIFLRAARLSEDDRLLGTSEFQCLGKPRAQGTQERQSLRVLGNRNSKIAESPQVSDLAVDIGDIVLGQQLCLCVVLFPLAGTVLKLLIVVSELVFELLPQVRIVAKLALQFAGEGIQSSGDGESR